MKKMLRNWIEKWDKVVMALLSLLALIPVCLLWNSIAPVICGFGRITLWKDAFSAGLEFCCFGHIIKFIPRQKYCLKNIKTHMPIKKRMGL